MSTWPTAEDTSLPTSITEDVTTGHATDHEVAHDAIRTIETALGLDSGLPLDGTAFPRTNATKIFYAAQYSGLDPTGSTDSAPAIQAALADARAVPGGTVILPPGTFRLDSTLVLEAHAVHTYLGPSLIGASHGTTILNWQGATTGAALQIDKQKYFAVRNLRFTNGVATGTTRAISFATTGIGGGAGTQAGAALFENIFIEDFSRGVSIGDFNAASEIIFLNLIVYRADYGVYVQDSNSLNFHFLLPQFASCGRGIYAVSGGAITVLGGSASFSTEADFESHVAGIWNVTGFRSEHANRVFRGFSTVLSFLSVSLDTIQAQAPANADTVLFHFSGATHATLTGCIIGGKVVFDAATANGVVGAGLAMLNCGVASTSPYEAASGASIDALDVFVRLCREIDSAEEVQSVFSAEG